MGLFLAGLDPDTIGGVAGEGSGPLAGPADHDDEAGGGFLLFVVLAPDEALDFEFFDDFARHFQVEVGEGFVGGPAAKGFERHFLIRIEHRFEGAVIRLDGTAALVVMEEELVFGGPPELDVEGLNIFEDGGVGRAGIFEMQDIFEGGKVVIADYLAADGQTGGWVGAGNDPLHIFISKGFLMLLDLPSLDKILRGFAVIHKRKRQVDRLAGYLAEIGFQPVLSQCHFFG
ncbi:MAG: hypothetical protein BWY71_02249 [Planctomycetes bacterium ADurb.Bin412]|nr:MAG: hypothetical protein BWY71_02249 [Planctomycetes bacterium ADurb.Bin412]